MAPSHLLKVYHAGDVQASQESDGNPQNRSSKKVIKATITIPMPKADLGAVKFKVTKKPSQQLQQEEEFDDDQEVEMAFDDEDSPRIKESVPIEFSSD